LFFVVVRRVFGRDAAGRPAAAEPPIDA